MIRSIRKCEGVKIRGIDSDIGRVGDVYVDDQDWLVRYLSVDLGRWLPGRQFLLSPSAVGLADWTRATLHVDLTCRQIEKSPDIACKYPPSRQNEMELAEYFGWPTYWTGPSYGGFDLTLPGSPSAEASDEDLMQQAQADNHLRSARDLRGYRILTNDGPIGHVDDLLADDESWEVRYLVVAKRNLLPGKKVLVKPQWVLSIMWIDQVVRLDMDKETIQNSPAYRTQEDITTRYEAELDQYYHEIKEL